MSSTADGTRAVEALDHLVEAAAHQEVLAGLPLTDQRAPWEQLDEPAQVVRRALATLDVHVLHPRRCRIAHAWLARGGAVMAIVDPELPEGVQVAAMLPQVVVGALPRLLHLGPRPAQDLTIPLPESVAEEVLDRSPESWAEELEGAPAGADDARSSILRAFLTAPRVHWRVTAGWGSSSRACEVVDVPAAGIWRLVALPTDAPVQGRLLQPSSTSAVWRELTSLLPGDGELTG